MYVLTAAAALIAAWFIFMMVTGLCERQYLFGCVEPATEPFPYPASAYWRATGSDAMKAEFLHLGA